MIKGFEAYETIYISFVNFDFAGNSFPSAQKLVQSGSYIWVHGYAGTLKLVPKDYNLKPYEHFLRQTSDRLFERID